MPYSSDLTDNQWEIIKHHFDTGNRGKSRKHSQRELINAVFYLVKTGCQWRFLPKDFPPYSTVHTFYWRAKKRQIWDKMLQDLVKKSRVKIDKNADPTYSLIAYD